MVKGSGKDPCSIPKNHKVVHILHSYEQKEFIDGKYKLLKED